MVRRFAAAAIVLVGLGAGAVLFASPASAHATVVGSSPVDGSRLQSVPATVEIDFDQSVSIGGNIGYLHVINQAGQRVDLGSTVHPDGDASKIQTRLKSGLGDGTYTGSFRIISADSHPVSGAIRFVVGNGALAAALALPSTVNPTVSVIFDVVRWVGFTGFALLAGGWLMFSVWPSGRDDRRARSVVWIGWLVSVAGAVAEVVVQGTYAAGLGPSTLFNWGLIDATLHTDYGLAHAWRLIALGALGAVLGLLLRWIADPPHPAVLVDELDDEDYDPPLRPRLEIVGGLLMIAIAVTFALSGHATSEHPQWLATTSDTLHVLAMGVWVGGLVMLLACVLPRREPDELAVAMPAFSRAAFVSVTTLAVTGTYQAFLGVGTLRALIDTSYGQLVLVKIGLFCALIGLGNLGRVAVQRHWGRIPVAYAMTEAPMISEPTPAEVVRRLRRSVGIEAVLAATVLGFTAVLIAEAPGTAALITQDSRPQTTTVQISSVRTAAITLSSRRTGDLTVTVVLSQGAAPQKVTATAALPAKQLGPVAIPLAGSASGYSASSVLFPSAGSWLITLTVQTSQFDSSVAQAQFTIH